MKNLMKKTLAVATAAALSLTMSISAFAAKFPDVTNANYPWAVEAIESMAEKGIIKGYEDGSFNPAKTVSKLESLVLISRILGVNIEENTRIAEASWDTYGDIITEYDLSFGEQEIAYLLAKRILTVEELENYIASANRDDGLKRYEAATLLVKALDAERTIPADIVSTLTYADASDIPAQAKKYVAYASSKELLQGVGDNRFAPNDTVTRAQAAVILHKLETATQYTYKSGIVSSIDSTTRQIKVKQADENILAHYIISDTLIRYNGEVIGINDIEVGYDATLTYKDDTLYAIDFTDALVDDIIRGSFVGSSSSTAKGTVITLNVIEDNHIALDTTTKTEFKVADGCIITYNNNTCALTTLKAGYYVTLTVEDGYVTVIEAVNKEKTISGRVDEVIIEPFYKLKIEENGGEVNEYNLASDVKVTRNGKSSNARAVLAGDSVSITTSYGIIKSIVATSKPSAKTGIIKEVIISSTPKLTLTYDGVDTTYYMAADAEITLSNAEATFYDLRVGLAASVKLESDTIVSLESVLSDDVITWTGTVTNVNSSYGLVQIEFVDSTTGQTRTESVYVKEKASIVDYETQKAKKLSNITPGMKINVTGSMQTGLFEAGAIIIIG
ncbi:MAG: S-layer homology domain-containing protein [Ruminococcaceae bacterium]|nr:S-layer homology domain-containing protein [Oscillospiraceae bacterium]